MCYFYRFARQRHLPPFFPPVTFFKAKCLCLSTRCYCVIGGQASECMLAMVQLIWREQQCSVISSVMAVDRQCRWRLWPIVLWLADTLMTLPPDCSYTPRDISAHLDIVWSDDPPKTRWSTFGACTITCAIVYAGTAAYTARLLTFFPLPLPFQISIGLSSVNRRQLPQIVPNDLFSVAERQCVYVSVCTLWVSSVQSRTRKTSLGNQPSC